MQTNYMTHDDHERLWALLSIDERRQRKGMAAGPSEVSERIHPENGSDGLGGGRDFDHDASSLCELVVTSPPGLILPKDKVIRISVIEGPSKGLSTGLAKPHISIGRRGGGADIEVDDQQVSDLHCAIGVKRDIIRLLDLDSHNGTYVRNHRVSGASLEHLSEFRVGSSVLLVTVLPAQAASRADRYLTREIGSIAACGSST